MPLCRGSNVFDEKQAENSTLVSTAGPQLLRIDANVQESAQSDGFVGCAGVSMRRQQGELEATYRFQ